MTAPTWTLSSDPARLQMDVVYEWLTGAYWSEGIRRDVVERGFSNSLVVGAYAGDGRQVGVARLVTDQATFAWLCDVFVADEARGQGLARAMVKRFLEDPRLQTLRRWCLATRDAHGVYQPLGFATVNAATWMEWLPPRSNWQKERSGAEPRRPTPEG